MGLLKKPMARRSSGRTIGVKSLFVLSFSWKISWEEMWWYRTGPPRYQILDPRHSSDHGIDADGTQGIWIKICSSHSRRIHMSENSRLRN
jgi:hypothetical protein